MMKILYSTTVAISLLLATSCKPEVESQFLEAGIDGATKVNVTLRMSDKRQLTVVPKAGKKLQLLFVGQNSEKDAALPKPGQQKVQVLPSATFDLRAKSNQPSELCYSLAALKVGVASSLTCVTFAKACTHGDGGTFTEDKEKKVQFCTCKKSQKKTTWIQFLNLEKIAPLCAKGAAVAVKPPPAVQLSAKQKAAVVAPFINACLKINQQKKLKQTSRDDIEKNGCACRKDYNVLLGHLFQKTEVADNKEIKFDEFKLKNLQIACTELPGAQGTPPHVGTPGSVKPSSGGAGAPGDGANNQNGGYPSINLGNPI